MRRQMAEIGESDLGIADDTVQFADFLMRQREKRIEQAKLVHDLQGRGVDRIAAKIAQKIAVFLADDHFDPGTNIVIELPGRFALCVAMLRGLVGIIVGGGGWGVGVLCGDAGLRIDLERIPAPAVYIAHDELMSFKLAFGKPLRENRIGALQQPR